MNEAFICGANRRRAASPPAEPVLLDAGLRPSRGASPGVRRGGGAGHRRARRSAPGRDDASRRRRRARTGDTNIDGLREHLAALDHRLHPGRRAARAGKAAGRQRRGRRRRRHLRRHAGRSGVSTGAGNRQAGDVVPGARRPRRPVRAAAILPRRPQASRRRAVASRRNFRPATRTETAARSIAQRTPRHLPRRPIPATLVDRRQHRQLVVRKRPGAADGSWRRPLARHNQSQSRRPASRRRYARRPHPRSDVAECGQRQRVPDRRAADQRGLHAVWINMLGEVESKVALSPVTTNIHRVAVDRHAAYIRGDVVEAVDIRTGRSIDRMAFQHDQSVFGLFVRELNQTTASGWRTAGWSRLMVSTGKLTTTKVHEIKVDMVRFTYAFDAFGIEGPVVITPSGAIRSTATGVERQVLHSSSSRIAAVAGVSRDGSRFLLLSTARECS